MNAQQIAINSLIKHIADGMALRASAEENRKDIANAIVSIPTLEAQWEFVGTQIMPIIAKMKGYNNPRIEKVTKGENKDIAYRFVDRKTGKSVTGGARNFLRDRLSLTTLLAGVGSTNKSKRSRKEKPVTPRKTKRVTELLVMFNNLSSAERAAFLASAK